MSISYQLLNQENKARRGKVSTPHGDFDTPAFMPVGTNATVKALTPEEVAESGSQILLSNAYHLYLRPGQELVKQMGGLHKFMNWSRPILTDSGGFQVFSLAKLRDIDDDGVTFRSHIDGSKERFTPESVMQLENDLGADIIMCFDECTPHDVSPEYAANSVNLTSRWAERCLKAHGCDDQALFAIVQGGIYKELREQSARELMAMDFPGYAVGGLMIGEDKSITWPICDSVCQMLPTHKPRYLMGVGTPEDILNGIYYGIDMFDCVHPTRIARNGHYLTWNGKITIKQAHFREDPAPIDEHCLCYCCQHYSRAYLRHLFLAGEILASRLATIHNIHFFQQFMQKCRQSITDGNFAKFRKQWLETHGLDEFGQKVTEKK